MKNIILCTLLVAMCLVMETKADCEYMGKNYKVGEKYTQNCAEFTCQSGGGFGGLTCALYECMEGKKIGYKEQDNSKPYPQCCGGPICLP
ncbi:PREDICTED: uncharacterized protein LOC107190407 [Dufourea novaeangliae]|uniref:uncharacterized protein LOC107190407 n=1 Tax=Dufourea novaeangliae TaxID=178035 RepID=UPI00076722AC|nr:PREDICTED: uncharacterized protein LOC107190407 [Dufourea novaeangliae]